MSLPLFTDNLNIISALDDSPVMDAQELKAKFDEAANIIQTYINEELIPAIEAEISYAINEAAVYTEE